MKNLTYYNRFGQLSLLAAVLVVLAVPLPSYASEKPDLPEELATRAIIANPAIKSVERQIEALLHKVDSVQVWSDPVLAVDYLNVPWDSWSLGDTPMSGVQFKLKQTFPLPGKNDRRQAVAQGELKVKKWELAERKNKLRAMVKQAFWKLALVRELKRITSRHIDLLGQLVVVVRVKYQVGKSGQHDLLRLEVLKKKLTDDLGDFVKRDKQLTAAINAALHRDRATPIETPNKLELPQARLKLTGYLRLAEQNRPLLKQTLAMSAWHRQAADAAAYERWPDITVWAGYRIRSAAGADPSTDFFSVGLAIPLPFDYTNRHEAKEAEHLSNASAADEAKRSIFDEIRAALETALAAWDRAAQKVTTYREVLIPEADKTLKATLSAYTSDRADFTSLYQAELQLLEFDRAIQIAEITAQLEQVRVELEVGTRLHTVNSEVQR
ncbi:MAG: TolC family protein [Deltaproteobacteria bacterium]|nr:TolC family protein [Deltaproteobacteria bacterium]